MQIAAVLLNGALSLYSQEGGSYDFPRIEDNSFLLEEAYNQDAGVIQHISAFQYTRGGAWAYSFTEEWPVPGQKHQLSATIPVTGSSPTGFGDVALNYRYQLVFTERLAVSPRLSFVVPTGDYHKGLGNSVPGYQLNLPASFIFSHRIVSHFNLGYAWTHSARDPLGERNDLSAVNYGLSTIMLVSQTFNLMLELAGVSERSERPDGTVSKDASFFINPGFRYAVNCKSGLQIVPGLAFPLETAHSGITPGVFLYLSFEHPLWNPGQ